MSYSQYLSRFETKMALACTVDTSLPTFAGISSVTPNSDGSFSVSWSSATSTKTPVRYEVFVAVGSVSAASLFVTANRVLLSPSALTTIKVFVLRDQVTYFVNGQLYTFGVRAVDAQNYSDTNTAILTSTAIASGNIGGLFQATELLLAADHANFQADHANFQSDHTNFGTDHTNFQADHANFQTDHANLAADATSLAASATSLSSSATSIGSSASSLSTSATSIASSASSLASSATTFTGDLTIFAGQLTTLNGYLTTLASDLTDLAAENATFSLSNSTFISSLSTFASDLTTLANDLTTFSTQNGILTTEVSTLSGLVSALQIAISSVSGIGGLDVILEPTPTLSIEIVMDDGEVI